MSKQTHQILFFFSFEITQFYLKSFTLKGSVKFQVLSSCFCSSELMNSIEKNVFAEKKESTCKRCLIFIFSDTLRNTRGTNKKLVRQSIVGTVTRSHRGFTLLRGRSIIPAIRTAIADWLQLRCAFYRPNLT